MISSPRSSSMVADEASGAGDENFHAPAPRIEKRAVIAMNRLRTSLSESVGPPFLKPISRQGKAWLKMIYLYGGGLMSNLRRSLPPLSSSKLRMTRRTGSIVILTSSPFQNGKTGCFCRWQQSASYFQEARVHLTPLPSSNRSF